MSDETLTFVFSDEELAYLLLGGKYSPIVELGNAIFTGLTPPQRDLALAVADRALQARGIILARPQGERVIDLVTSSLLQHYTHPHYRVVCEVRKQDQIDTIYYAVDDRVCVEHVAIAPGIHRFTSVITAANTRALLSEHLALPQQAVAGAMGSCASSLLTMVETQVKTNPHEAYQALARQLPEPLARAVFAVLGERYAHVRLQLIAQSVDTANSLAFLLTPEYIISLDYEQTAITLQQVDQAAVWALIEQHLRPALTLLH